jgi:NAD-dependent deacetylase
MNFQGLEKSPKDLFSCYRLPAFTQFKQYDGSDPMGIPDGVISEISKAKRIAVLTGAGISAESGIMTFRGKNGIWEKFEPDEVATPAAWAKDPKKVWDFHEGLQQAVSESKPNSAHLTLAEMEDHFEEFALITQNIDNYHRDAGSKNVIELHGNAFRMKCTGCGTVSRDTEIPKSELPPKCTCGSLLRPDVVWFNEPLPGDALNGAFAASESCEVMLVIGTSAFVQPAALMPSIAHEHGATVIEFNLEPTPHTGLAIYSFFGKAGETLPRFWDAVKKL